MGYHTDINVVEKRQIKSCTDGVFLPLSKNRMATVIAGVESLEDVC